MGDPIEALLILSGMLQAFSTSLENLKDNSIDELNLDEDTVEMIKQYLDETVNILDKMIGHIEISLHEEYRKNR